MIAKQYGNSLYDMELTGFYYMMQAFHVQDPEILLNWPLQMYKIMMKKHEERKKREKKELDEAKKKGKRKRR